MKIIKETTLHPEGNDGVDLYPKTNINQVEKLPQKLTYLETQVSQLNANKLTKPNTPSAESAITMTANGRVETKPLSEIGGGKLYRHRISATLNTGQANIGIDIINTSNTQFTENEYFRTYLDNPIVASFDGAKGSGAVIVRYVIPLSKYVIEGAVIDYSNTGAGYYVNIKDTFKSFNDTVTEL